MPQDYFNTFEFRLNSLRANMLSPRKLRPSTADLAQADSIYSDAHRAGRDDVKQEVRAMLERASVAA